MVLTTMKKQKKPGDMFKAYQKMKWGKGIENKSINKSGTVGTEAISKGDKKYTEVKLGKIGKIDIPRGKLKKAPKKKKLSTVAGKIKEGVKLAGQVGKAFVRNATGKNDKEMIKSWNVKNKKKK